MYSEEKMEAVFSREKCECRCLLQGLEDMQAVWVLGIRRRPSRFYQCRLLHIGSMDGAESRYHSFKSWLSKGMLACISTWKPGGTDPACEELDM